MCQFRHARAVSRLVLAVPWLIPTLLYVLLVGGLGVTGKLALKTLNWPDLILWTAVGYLLVAVVLLVIGQTAVRITAGTGWAMLSAGLAIGGLIALYLALGAGPAGSVVAISAAYPAVTVVLAALFLAEPLSLARVLGTGLIVAGVAIVSLSR
jgi:uncharacterized membrane protein